MYSYAVTAKCPASHQRLKVIGAIEAVSFLLLLGVAMPLKYAAGIPEPVTWIGGAHGVLWVLYLLALLLAWRDCGWSFGRAFAGAVASVLPFGPFLFEAKIAKSA